tara:strand:+ start:2370 stop:3485 length:1116 start_codon:yes stop_codon:yes gene_type:complete
VYINFWYPVILGEELKDEPVKVRMLGQNFVVFRDSEGNPNTLHDICIHRGASLSEGLIKKDCIQCPYHGWQFDGKGECKKIPSLGKDAEIPKRAKIDAYPTEEKYGIVFAFLGELPKSQRPPIMPIEELDDEEGWRPNYLTYEAKINYERSIENGLDAAHNEFVHPTHGHEGEDDDYKVNELKFEDSRFGVAKKWGFGFWHPFKSPGSKKEGPQIKEASEERWAGSGIVGPNQMWTYIVFNEKSEFRQYMFECPVEENHVRIFLVNMRKMMLDPAMDKPIADRCMVVAQQDIDVLEKVEPSFTPVSNTKEFLVPADEPCIRYRKLLSGWEKKGWKIDSDAVSEASGKIAYAIPSPLRKKQKGWVIDKIPLS